MVADFARYRCSGIARMGLFAALETQPLQNQAQTVRTKVPSHTETLFTHLTSNCPTHPHGPLHFAKPPPHNPAHKAPAPTQLLGPTLAVHTRFLLSLNFKTHLLLVNKNSRILQPFHDMALQVQVQKASNHFPA